MIITKAIEIYVFLSLLFIGKESYAHINSDPDCAITAAMEVKAGSNVNQFLIAAAAEGNLQKVEAALRAGASTNYSDDELGTPLAWASRCNNLEAVKLLISKGADVNLAVSYQKDMHYKFKNSSALIWAASNDNINVIRYLLGKGADIGRVEDIYEIKNDDASVFLSKGRSAYTATENRKVLSLFKK